MAGPELAPRAPHGRGRCFAFWGQRVVVTAGRVVVVVDVDAAPRAVMPTTRPPRTHGTSRRDQHDPAHRGQVYSLAMAARASSSDAATYPVVVFTDTCPSCLPTVFRSWHAAYSAVP